LVLHKQVVDFGSGSSSKIKQTAYSDANGNFVLKHNGSLVNKFIVLVEYPDGTEGYHLVGWKDESGNPIGTYQLPVEKGELMKVDLELLPYCFVTFHYNNLICFDLTDSLFVDVRSSEYVVTNGYEIKVWGCGINDYGPVKLPQGAYFINGRVKKNNIISYINYTYSIYPDSANVFDVQY